ncbi:MAG: DUF4956 domain-containing protein [Bacteroidales bacterium]|nr:DUF4956 domain-containing protein [Bacteroidales bacterium]
MNKYDIFEMFNINTEEQVGYAEFLINVVIVLILSVILELTYIKCAKSISNRRMFSSNFLLIAFTTMLIISVVKTSIALSLGLVGALSIVRFRSAIKEPEELAFLFLTISIGLGLGAGQRNITMIAFAAIMAIIWLRYFINRKPAAQNLYITVSMPSDGNNLNDVISTVKDIFGRTKVSRFDRSGEVMEATLLIDSNDPGKLNQCTESLEKRFSKIRISFVDVQ